MFEKASKDSSSVRIPFAKSSSEIDSEGQWRVFGVILAVLVVSMMGAAVVLPESVGDFPLAVKMLVDAVCIVPNIDAFASKASSPIFMRSYLAIGLIASIACSVAFIIFRGAAQPTTPFPSSDKKIIVVIGLFVLVGLTTSVWWNSAIPQKSLGLLEGRWGAFMYMALSTRVGAATLGSAIFFVGPFMAISVLWSAIKRPVV